MLRNKWFITLTLIGLATVIVACSIQTTPTPESNIGTDQLAETLVAIQTLSAGATAVAELTQISQATPTSGSQQPGVPTPIIVATTTVAQPTLVVPTVAPPAPTAISVPCNWAQYITDVTFPDYSQILPGTAFTKVWRVKNIGTAHGALAMPWCLQTASRCKELILKPLALPYCPAKQPILG
jgi:hypothetical protein